MTIRAFRHLETTPPLVHACKRCDRPVLYGVAEGSQVRADITPVDQAGEIAAVLAGRATYTLRRSGLIQRDASRRGDPTLAAPVVVQHVCPEKVT